MKVVIIRSKRFTNKFDNENISQKQVKSAIREKLRINAKTSSSSKYIILGLIKRKFVTECEEWRFWDGDFQEVWQDRQMPVKLFPCDDDYTLEVFKNYLSENGQPDIIWVEGTKFPKHIRRAFQLCPDSYKVVYSKDWRPWKVEGLGAYNLCLVDEDWEIQRVKACYPTVECLKWDKVVDYNNMHYPLKIEKKYDLCYIAHYRERKNHALLFRAMAKIKDRDLTSICIGGNRKGHREELEEMAKSFDLNVHFTDEVPHEIVNFYINQSRIGVMCSKYDAAPRAVLEYMAANVPVVVNAELLAGTRYIGPTAGVVKSPEEFHIGILEILDNYQNYSPRDHMIENYSVDKVVSRFIDRWHQIKDTKHHLNSAYSSFRDDKNDK